MPTYLEHTKGTFFQILRKTIT